MISRCPSCGAPAPDEARQCRACGWDFVTNKKGEKNPEPPKKPEPGADKPKSSVPPSAAGGLSLPPARGGSAEVPATGLGMARLPKVEAGGAPAPGAPEESPFALPVARNLGPKPGESLFSSPPPPPEAKLPEVRAKEAAPPEPEEPPKKQPPLKKEEPPKKDPPRKIEAPKPVPEPEPEPVVEEEVEAVADEELSAALFLPSSTKEIVVKPVEKRAKPEPKEPEPESIFAKPGAADPPKAKPRAAPSKPETEEAPKPPAGRQTAVYLAALAGGALGLFSIGAIFMMLRTDPQGAARPAGSSPFGKRASGEATMTPGLDEPSPPAPLPMPSPRSPAPIASSEEPLPMSIPAPAMSKPVAPPPPVAVEPQPIEAPKPAPPVEAPKPKPARATATFARPFTHDPTPKPFPKPKPPAAAKKPVGPQWVFEGTVYDLLSTRGVYGVRLIFIDAEDNEVSAIESSEGGKYYAAMKPGPAEGYTLRIEHDDYSGKHIDELDSTSSVRKADLEQRKFLMQAGARSLPWIGSASKPVRRDMALVPKASVE